jgi:hypothetical protein
MTNEVNSTLPLSEDVVRLVLAARIVAYKSLSLDALRELDLASEAFAERVPWDDEPEGSWQDHFNQFADELEGEA